MELLSMYTLYKYIFSLTCVVVIPTIHIASEGLELKLPIVRLTAGKRSTRISGEVYKYESTNGSCKTLDGEVHYKKEISKAETEKLDCAVNHCLARACDGIIDLQPLEGFILEHSVIGEQQESPWKNIRDIQSSQCTTQCNTDTAYGLPSYTLPKLVCLTIQSHLDLGTYPQLAEEYLAIVKNIFSAKPFVNVDAVEAAMCQLDLPSGSKKRKLESWLFINNAEQDLPRRNAKSFLWHNKIKCGNTSNCKKITPTYKLGTRQFVGSVMQQELERCIPPNYKGQDRRATTIQLFDFFDIVCYALYHGDTLLGFDVEGSNVKRIAQQVRLHRLEHQPFWQGIEHILIKAVEDRKAAEKFEQTNAHNQISIENPDNV
jgi:hypothetical protein